MSPDVFPTRRKLLMMCALASLAPGLGAKTLPGTAASQDDKVAYYASPGQNTDLGEDAAEIRAAGLDVGGLTRIVQGLLIHDFFAESQYGVRLSAEASQSIHLRRTQDVLHAAKANAPGSILLARKPADRVASRCHQYAKLLTAMLRAKGIAARARCGFAGYLAPGVYEDHWVCEYWQPEEMRWITVDPTIDAALRPITSLKADPLDLPESTFLSAGAAWQLCARNQADPKLFGVSALGLTGLWMIAGNLVRDIAALNKMEMLPWDAWGAQPWPNVAFSDTQTTWFNDVAVLSAQPDANWAAVKARFQQDPGLRIPSQIFNSLRQRYEAA